MGTDLFGEEVVEQPDDDEESGAFFDEPQDYGSPFDNEPEPSAGLADPINSETIYGHDDLEQHFLSLFKDNKLPHAVIFGGLKGIGKASFAFRLARFLLNNESDKQANSLATPKDHRIFRQISSLSHPDFLLIEPPMDERKKQKKDNIPVEEIRKAPPFMRKTASLEGWRLVIVDDADLMNKNAQNALLKVLEEPPQKAMLILVTHRPGLLLPTIRSRAPTFNFTALAKEHYKTLLDKSDAVLTDEYTDVLYDMTDGSIGTTLQILEEGGIEAIENSIALLGSYPNFDWEIIYGLSDSIRNNDKGFRTLSFIMRSILQMIVKSKAQNQEIALLVNSPQMKDLYSTYSLAQWIEICDTVEDIFNRTGQYGLDKRQSLIEIFSYLENKRAA